jgi:hypothetical protein
MKGAVGIANWIVRIALVLVLILSFLGNAEAVLNGSTAWSNILGLAAVILGALLLIGGFMRKHTTTVVSALILTIIFVISIINEWNGVNTEFALLLLMTGTALYFAAAGNGR